MVAIDLHSKWNKETMDVNGYCQQKKETHTGSDMWVFTSVSSAICLCNEIKGHLRVTKDSSLSMFLNTLKSTFKRCTLQ